MLLTMVLILIGFVAGCAAGGFLSVWPVVAASTLALVVGVVGLLAGAMTWSAALQLLAAPTLALQAGFVIALLVSAMVRKDYAVTTADSADQASDGGKHAELSAGRTPDLS